MDTDAKILYCTAVLKSVGFILHNVSELFFENGATLQDMMNNDDMFGAWQLKVCELMPQLPRLLTEYVTLLTLPYTISSPVAIFRNLYTYMCAYVTSHDDYDPEIVFHSVTGACLFSSLSAVDFQGTAVAREIDIQTLAAPHDSRLDALHNRFKREPAATVRPTAAKKGPVQGGVVAARPRAVTFSRDVPKPLPAAPLRRPPPKNSTKSRAVTGEDPSVTIILREPS